MTGASRYLLVLYLAAQGQTEPISPGDVAEAVGRSPSATTEMLQRLEARGLITYEPYEGATLTASGREQAEELHETYVVLSRFFRDVLELDEPDTEALEVAGAVSPIVTERLVSTILDDDNSSSPSPPEDSL